MKFLKRGGSLSEVTMTRSTKLIRVPPQSYLSYGVRSNLLGEAVYSPRVLPILSSKPAPGWVIIECRETTLMSGGGVYPLIA